MSYVRAHSVPGTRLKRVGSGVGDDALPAGSVGIPNGVDQTMYLTAQINRFMGPGAPAKRKLSDTPLPLASGKLSATTAGFAVLIMDYRTQEKFDQDPTLNARVKMAYADPVGFVEKNMVEVVSTIQAYADVLGAPPAQFPGAGGSPNVKIAVAAVIGAGTLYLLTRRR